jgi:hypothetical protein
MQAVLAGALALTQTAAAERQPAPDRQKAAAQAYARRHDLPVRTVELRVDGRKVQRTFVPVMVHTAKDFAGRFNAEKGAVVLRQSAQDHVHMSLLFRFGEGYGYGMHPGVDYVPVKYPMKLQHDGVAGGYIGFPRGAGNHFYYDAAHPTWSPVFKGRYVVMALDRPQITHLRRFLARGQAGKKGAECVHGGCIWWLVHAPVGPEQPLAWAMGVKQSRAPEVLARKLIHAGNERVGVIGIAVDSVDEFAAMKDADLLGPVPQMGVAEAVR